VGEPAPGTVVLAAAGSMIVLAGDAAVSLVRALEHAVLSREPFEASIDAFTSAGVLGLPSFAAAFADERRCRILVRGAGSATVESATAGSVEVHARSGVTTWREEVVDEVTTAALRVDGESADVRLLVAETRDAAVSSGSGDARTRPVDGPPPAVIPIPEARPGSENLGSSRGGLDDDEQVAGLDPVGEPGIDTGLDSAPDSASTESADAGPGRSVAAETLVAPAGLEPIGIAESATDPGDVPEEQGAVDTHASAPVAGDGSSASDAEPPASASADPDDSFRNPLEETSFDFAHLVDRTVFRGAEAAAVRTDSDTDGVAGAGTTPGDAPAGLGTTPTTDHGPGLAADGATPSVGQPMAGAPASIETPPSTPDPTEADGAASMIDAVPRLGPISGGSPDDSAGALDDDRSGPGSGDHDGYTIAASSLRSLLGSEAAPPGTESVVLKSVQAVFCGQGHATPPHSDVCRECGGAITDRIVRTVPRPVLGRLRFATGSVVELDRPQLIGRRPTPRSPVSGSGPVGLVTMPDPEQELSRTHAEVRLDGWDVFVVDCGSKNGTFVELPGHAPIKLRADEPCLLVARSRVSLSGTAEFTFEVGAG